MIPNKLALLIFLVFGCTSVDHRNQTPKRDTVISERSKIDMTGRKEDTTIIFHINGKQFVYQTSLPVGKSELNEEYSIDSVARIFKNRNLDSTYIDYKDVTGDGKLEKLVSHLFHLKIKSSDSEAYILTHNIYHDNVLIFTDTLNYNDAPVDYLAEALYPYSYFTILLQYMPMVYKYDVADFSKDEEYILSMRKSVLENKHLSYREIESELKKYKDYLLHFNGYLVTGTDFMDGWTNIWYEPEHKFIQFEGP